MRSQIKQLKLTLSMGILCELLKEAFKGLFSQNWSFEPNSEARFNYNKKESSKKYIHYRFKNWKSNGKCDRRPDLN